jgi:protein-S-isoprenylcysteine O-methyltransferase Ste14
LLAWGICWKQANGLTVGLALFASCMLYLTAKRDEAECQAYFGDAYGRYMQRNRMFIPWLF